MIVVKARVMELTLTAFLATARYKSKNLGILSLLTLNIVTRITFGIVTKCDLCSRMSDLKSKQDKICKSR